jgi:hypothetical protein
MRNSWNQALPRRSGQPWYPRVCRHSADSRPSAGGPATCAPTTRRTAPPTSSTIPANLLHRRSSAENTTCDTYWANSTSTCPSVLTLAALASAKASRPAFRRPTLPSGPPASDWLPVHRRLPALGPRGRRQPQREVRRLVHDRLDRDPGCVNRIRAKPSRSWDRGRAEDRAAIADRRDLRTFTAALKPSSAAFQAAANARAAHEIRTTPSTRDQDPRSSSPAVSGFVEKERAEECDGNRLGLDLGDADHEGAVLHGELRHERRPLAIWGERAGGRPPARTQAAELKAAAPARARLRVQDEERKTLISEQEANMGGGPPPRASRINSRVGRVGGTRLIPLARHAGLEDVPEPAHRRHLAACSSSVDFASTQPALLPRSSCFQNRRPGSSDSPSGIPHASKAGAPVSARHGHQSRTRWPTRRAADALDDGHARGAASRQLLALGKRMRPNLGFRPSFG